MEKVWAILIERGIFRQDHGSRKGQSGPGTNFCKFHKMSGHTLQNCIEFLGIIQRMMDNGEIKFFEEVG